MIRVLLLLLAVVLCSCRTVRDEQASSEAKAQPTGETQQPSDKRHDPARYAKDAALVTAEFAKSVCSCVFVQRFEASYCATSTEAHLEGLTLTPAVDLAIGRVTVQGETSNVEFTQAPAAPIQPTATFAFDAQRPNFGCEILKVVPPLP